MTGGTRLSDQAQRSVRKARAPFVRDALRAARPASGQPCSFPRGTIFPSRRSSGVTVRAEMAKRPLFAGTFALVAALAVFAQASTADTPTCPASTQVTTPGSTSDPKVAATQGLGQSLPKGSAVPALRPTPPRTRRCGSGMAWRGCPTAASAGRSTVSVYGSGSGRSTVQVGECTNGSRASLAYHPYGTRPSGEGQCDCDERE